MTSAVTTFFCILFWMHCMSCHSLFESGALYSLGGGFLWCFLFCVSGGRSTEHPLLKNKSFIMVVKKT